MAKPGRAIRLDGSDALSSKITLTKLADALRLPCAIEYAKHLWRQYNPHCEVVGWDVANLWDGTQNVRMRVRLGRHEATLAIHDYFLATYGCDADNHVRCVVQHAWRDVAERAARDWRPL